MTSAPGNLGFYLSGSVLLLIGASKLPALIRRPHDMLLRAACLLLFTGGCNMLLAAPESIVQLNRLSGTANLAAPVVYATTTAFSGASLLLIINWRPAPPRQTRRASRLCVSAYGLVVLAVFLLYGAGSTPVEQVALFDVYYANTPYIREMIVTYLVAQGVAMMVACSLCWRWSREVHGSLRAGLRTLAPAYLIIVCYVAMRLVAVAARWSGHNLDFLVDQVSPRLAAPSAALGAVGFLLPLAGPPVATAARSVRQLWQLAPLWRALQDVSTPGAVRATLPWWRTPPAMLLTGRKTALYDAILALTPHCDPAVRESAHRAALRRGDDASSAEVTADAAMILVARERQAADAEQPPDGTPRSPWHARDLVPLSLALASPVVRDIHRQFAPSEKAAHHA
ncbi:MULTISPECIES: DUF6545 domain-containing protein [Streptomyces]|uniref:DUF6545 domain-containing protein n=1 Tax=Streptomyces spororaveus TaxID=284039 RepID=A0ABQ3T9W9_9ACTN|nr:MULTISPECIES: DUF6545 domain-containing protein [Streptomyces]MCM9082411.1 hypothetical protein [Streptomyces spororaveus]MCX5303014.1 hypothetical protein [Streptomyces sp. NBC_00160]GHI77176.1 hypothetical protein Sspor_27370 [Streptomyces spororaveus]